MSASAKYEQLSKDQLIELIQRLENERMAFIESSYDGYWDWHIQDGYEYMSPRFWEMFGIDPKTKKHDPGEWQDIINQDDLKLALANFQKHVDTRGAHPYNQEVRYRHVDGHDVTVYCRGQVIEWSDDGQPLRMIGTHTDITMLKRTNQQLKTLNEELTRSNRELENFCHVASHDLKAPLRGIRNIVEWIEEDCTIDAQAQGYLSDIRNRTSRLQTLISDLLAYSKIGQQKSTPELVDAPQVLREIATSLDAPADFRFDFDDNLPEMTTLAVPFEVVFRNLLSNSVKHRSSDAGSVAVSCMDMGEDLLFQVTDDGPGIPADMHERVFAIFQTLKPQDHVEGSGVGLAMARKAAETVRGDIQLESSEGEGATFVIRWPKVLQPAWESMAAAESDKSKDVDDESTVCVDRCRLERLEDLCDNSPHLLATVAPDSDVIEDCNATFVRKLGYAAKADVIGKSVLDVVCPDHREEAKLAIEELRVAGQLVSTRLDLAHTNESRLGAVLNVESKRDQSGKILYSRWSWADISSLKSIDLYPERSTEAEQELAQLRRRNELMAEGASVGIWDWVDVSRDEEHWTPKFYELLGYENGEIQASLDTFISIIHPEDVDRSFAMVERHFSHDEPFDIEYRLRRKDGHYRWFRGAGLVSRNAEGKPARMVGSIQDIHEQKVAQEALRRSNIELEEFANITSHDLRSPLKGIESLTDWVMEDCRLDDAGQLHMQNIRKRVRRMYTLLDDLLRFSKIGRIEHPVQKVDCNTLVASICEVIEIPSSFSLSVPEMLPTVQTEEAPLRTVIEGLLGNAIRHHDREDGCVKLSISDADALTPTLKIVVEDDGPGIPAHLHERAFQLFETLKPRDHVEGSGLGLAIIRKSVIVHGGTVELESTPGKGTRFVVHWPVENREP